MLKPDTLQRLADRDHKEGTAELLAELKKLPAPELPNLEPAILSRLTAEQRRSLFATPRKAQRLSNPLSSQQSSKRLKRLGLPRRLWFKLPVICRGQLLGLAISALLAGSAWSVDQYGSSLKSFWAYPISQDASTWLQCPRLTAQTDGCIYYPTTQLDWSRAAAFLQQPTAALRATNTHLNQNTLQPGDPLIIWRGNRSFQETN